MVRVLSWILVMGGLLLVINTNGINSNKPSSNKIRRQDSEEGKSFTVPLKDAVNHVKSDIASVKKVLRDARNQVQNNRTVDLVKPLVKILLNNTGKDFNIRNRNLTDALDDYFEDTNTADFAISNEILDLLERLGLKEPEEVKDELEHIIKDKGSQIPAIVTGIILDLKVINDTKDFLKKFPKSRYDLENLLNGVLLDIIYKEYVVLSDELKDKLKKAIDRLIEYFDDNDNDEETVQENLKDFIIARTENIIQDKVDSAFDDLFSEPRNEGSHKNNGSPIYIEKNVIISYKNRGTIL